MYSEIKIKIALVNALRYLESLNDLSIFNYNSLVFEAKMALFDPQIKNMTLPIDFDGTSLESKYVRLRKMINLPELKDVIFDISDLQIVGGCVQLSYKYKKERLEYLNLQNQHTR